MDIYGTNTKVSDLSLGHKARRGTVSVVLDTGWGPTNEITEFTDPFALKSQRLFSDTAKAALSDILIRAERVYCCRPHGGEYAVSAIGRAKHKGTSGNRITVSVKESDGSLWVTTYVDGTIVDDQTVPNGCHPVDNDYVIFSDSEMFITSGIPFTGGQDIIINEINYKACLDALSAVTSDIIVSGETSAPMVAAFSDFIEHIRGNGGTIKGVTTAEISTPGSAAITSVACCGGDGGAIYYIAGLLASLPFYRSAVGEKYEGSFDPGAFNGEYAALEAPHNRLILAYINGDAYVIRDNNSSEYVKLADNFKARLKDEILRRINGIFDDRYLGVVRANGAGTSYLQKDIADSLSELYCRYGISSSAPAVSVSADESGAVSVSVTDTHISRPNGIMISASL